MPAGFDDERALTAERDDDRGLRPCREPDRADAGRSGAGEGGELADVRGQERAVQARSRHEQAGEAGEHRSRVEHARHPDRGRRLDGDHHGGERDLGADEDAVGVRQRVDQRARAPGRASTPPFAPAPTAIWFSPARVHDDQRDAGRDAVEHGDPVDAHALGTQLVQRRAAGVVGADRADQQDVRAGPRGRDGGVGALAAAEVLDAGADDRLARPGQPLGARPRDRR